MTRRELSIQLNVVPQFQGPKTELEQYITPPDIAADLLWQLNLVRELRGDTTVIDYGCGTGMLGFGALLLGADHVHFVDVDGSVLQRLEEFLEEEDIPSDMYTVELNSAEYSTATKADIVLMNPPFGTRDKGADTKFLEKGMRVGDYVVSFHKTVTKQHIYDVVHSGGTHSVIFEQDYNFPLPNTHAHHREDEKTVEVTAFILQRLNL